MAGARDPDQLVVARLDEAAMRHATAGTPHEIAVAELRALAGGRADLLAAVAGLLAGFGQGKAQATGNPPDPRYPAAAALCEAAGADPQQLAHWRQVGYERAARLHRPAP